MPTDSLIASLEAALEGSSAPESILRTLDLVNVSYFSFRGEVCAGQILIHKDLATDISEIFNELVTLKFPIQEVTPIGAFSWDDFVSMANNNTSAFHYREIIGTGRLSNHALGRAIDINPMQNPYYAFDGNRYPVNSVYDPAAIGTILADSPIVSLFKERGWTWLGEREGNKDYQHFHKLEES